MTPCVSAKTHHCRLLAHSAAYGRAACVMTPKVTNVGTAALSATIVHQPSVLPPGMASIAPSAAGRTLPLDWYGRGKVVYLQFGLEHHVEKLLLVRAAQALPMVGAAEGADALTDERAAGVHGPDEPLDIPEAHPAI